MWGGQYESREKTATEKAAGNGHPQTRHSENSHVNGTVNKGSDDKIGAFVVEGWHRWAWHASGLLFLKLQPHCYRSQAKGLREGGQ